jgi:tRNA-2-methylthio-N6-dimethylallyladenosine synthase
MIGLMGRNHVGSAEDQPPAGQSLGGKLATNNPDTVGRRKVFVKSFGCQMNVYDATKMADILASEGFQETTHVAEADLIILNTCHIRERATEKVYSELGQLRALKNARSAQGLQTIIAVAGCVAQAEGVEIVRRQRAVDIVVGPQSYHRLPDLLRESERTRRVGQAEPIIETDFPVVTKFDRAIATRRSERSAFVTVQEGCDKFCTFCVVPYTRGSEMSRPVAQIIEEIAGLAEAGVREVTLLGQNVNAYHGPLPGGGSSSLANLVKSVAAVPGIQRVRYTTSHPSDMTQDLIDAHAAIPALMPFLHLPVQSGSDRILRKMNRRHTIADYLSLVRRVREARPDIALSSDFIVGFPGETEADFKATLELIDAVGFASTFSFKFSPRPGTPAADRSDQIEDAIKIDRLGRLQKLTEAQRSTFNLSTVGRTTEVLFVKQGRHAGQIAGKSPWMQPVQVEASSDLIGEVRAVEIIAAGSNSLFGKLARSAAALQETQD